MLAQRFQGLGDTAKGDFLLNHILWLNFPASINVKRSAKRWDGSPRVPNTAN